MTKEYIKVRGARQHNLKNVDLDIPKGDFVVFTGVSGSGKSSLAFDTIYAEGQRRYVESLSSYARQFLGVMQKPDMDSIEGLSPAISIDQKTTTHNPRSTVGTVTEIYDYFRLLFARVGHPHCPVCGREISSQSIDQIVGKIFSQLETETKKSKIARAYLLSPLVSDRKGEYSSLFSNIKAQGFRRVRVDKNIKSLDEDLVLIKTNKHTIDAVVDRFSLDVSQLKDEVSKDSVMSRLHDSVEQALKLSDGLVILSIVGDKSFDFPENPKDFEDFLFSEKFACPFDNVQIPEVEPRMFSFNTPHGACEKCNGLGKILQVNPDSVFSLELSILEGGILPFSTVFEHDTWYSRLIKTVCEANSIPTNINISKLSKEHIQLLLDGTGSREYNVEGTNRFGRKTYIVETFAGIKTTLEKRFIESQSEHSRNSLSKYMYEAVCPECNGSRLKIESLSVTINDQSIAQICDLTISKTYDWINKIQNEGILNEKEKEIIGLVLKEITLRLKFLLDVGLSYLTLSRSAETLAGGEAQRIRLASQIGSGLTGVLYVLDEPTIGLHPRDNKRLIETLKKLRDLGNTLLVVEHDEEIMRESDYIFDFGPKAGKFGGAIVAHGTAQELADNKNSVTGKYLKKGNRIVIPNVGKNNLREVNQKYLKLKGATENNLDNVDLSIPLGKLVSITGVSGSGKSTLIVDTLYHAASSKIYPEHREIPGEFKSIEGIEEIDKVILIDQSPIGRTPRSNPATYTKLFDLIRDIFANTKEAKNLGFGRGRFSFNVKGGRCESCEGQGQVKIEMQFMPDIWVTCDVCKGARYNSQTLDVVYKGKNISEVLKMTVSEAQEFFHIYTPIMTKLDTLAEVGLEYVELGQPATTLSGGEAQRVKLSSELSKRATGKTLYILDEPTTGLHFVDLEKLMKVLKLLVAKGNTVVVIEHNLDVIANSDWIIDLGPEGGDGGGKIISEGTPSEIKKNLKSHTGEALLHHLG